MVNSNLFTHVALRNSKVVDKTCPCIPDQQTEPTYGIQCQDSNSGHIGGRQVLSSLHHRCPPCTPCLCSIKYFYAASVGRRNKMFHVVIAQWLISDKYCWGYEGMLYSCLALNMAWFFNRQSFDLVYRHQSVKKYLLLNKCIVTRPVT